MSRMLIVGSPQPEHPNGEVSPDVQELFDGVCEALGRLLVAAGHHVFVCSQSTRTADHLVVAGASKESTATQVGDVTLYLSEGDRNAITEPQYFAELDLRNIRLQTELVDGGWFETYRKAIRDSDVVIGIGGSSRGTGTALYMALSDSKPIVAVPRLPGVSARLWTEFDSEFAQLPPEVVPSLMSGNNPTEIASAAIRASEQFVKSNPFPAADRRWASLLLPVISAICGMTWAHFMFEVDGDSVFQRYLPIALTTLTAGLLLRYAASDSRNAESYSGIIRVAKDLTACIATLIGLAVIATFAYSQATGTFDSTAQRIALWISVSAFTSGYLVESSRRLLTQWLDSTLRSVVRGGT